MNNGNPGIEITGIILSDVVIDENHFTTHEVVVYVEEGVEYPSPTSAPEALAEWVQNHAASAIRTKDDQIASRPNIWPDGTQHADVYRAWHSDNVSISIWTTSAPKPPHLP